MFQFRRLEGRGDIAVALDATGNSVLALTRTLNGTANLIGRQGALVGFNVEQLLRRLERRPLSGTGDFRNGRTPFEKLDGRISRSRDGTATVEDVQPGGLEGAARRSPARPRSRRAISICTGSPRWPPPARRRAAGVRTAVRGAGPVGRPDHAAGHPEPDPRSPAASPLLNAVRNRNTRDTVRSAIERLTGGAVSPPAGAPAAANRQALSADRLDPLPRRARGRTHAVSIMIAADESVRRRRAGDEARMLNPLIRTLVKVAVASLIVGTILAHFGITADQLIKEFGLSYERDRGHGPPRLVLGRAEPAARRDGDPAGVVPALPVPAARRQQPEAGLRRRRAFAQRVALADQRRGDHADRRPPRS